MPLAKETLVLILSVGLPSQALAQRAAPISHPIVGKWEWTLTTNNCTEVYEYRPDGTVSVSSGAERTTQKYTIASRPDENGFFELNGQVVKSNGARDCSDTPSGDTKPYKVFLIFNKTQPVHLVCETPALDKCFGPLKRVLP